MMKNLGHLTDSIFHHLNGKVADRGDYFVIRTPSNPTFFWGNCLLFKSAPTLGCFEKWIAVYLEEFGPAPAHMAIGWDSSDKGDPSKFLAEDFELNEDIVLTLTESSLTNVRTNPDLETRKLKHDWEWQAAIDLQIAEGCPGVSDADYRIFKTDQMANHRRNAERGHGDWWGAFLGNELAGNMGLFFDSSGTIGRFQDVGTAGAHRRKRVCTTLLDSVIRETLLPTNQLVIAAEQGSVAECIYRSAGFQENCFQFGLCKHLV